MLEAGRLRAAGVLLHRWLGLLIGAVFALVGATGAIVAYGPELLAWQVPAVAAPAPAGWQDARTLVLARTLEAHGPGQVALVRFPGAALGAYEIYLADESQEYRHALTGEVLHERPAWGDWILISRELHTHLGGGHTGELVLGWLGVGMLVLTLTGLWLWWPRGGRWRAAFRYPATRELRPQLYWWHKTGGLVTLGVLAFVTLTGVAMVFYGAAQALLTGLLGGEPPELAERVEPAGDIAWPAVLATLDATLPEGRTVYFYPPGSAGTPLTFRKKLPGELHPNGRSMVLVAPDGLLADMHDATEAGAGLRATNSIYPLHSGRTGAAWWKAVVACTGVLPVALFVTGFVLWRRSTLGARPR